MVVTIQKPGYLPNLEYFYRISRADTCIFLDSVKLARRDSVARTRILGHNGSDLIIVSVKRSEPAKYLDRGSRGHELLIKNARLEDGIFWRKKHLRRLYHVYRSTPYFEETYYRIKEIISQPWEYLADMNIELITAIARMLQLSCKFYRSSDFDINAEKMEYYFKLIKAVEGDIYLASEKDRPFICNADFKKNEISLIYDDFKHPRYRQNGDTFTGGLSIVDALFNCGKQTVHSFFTPVQ